MAGKLNFLLLINNYLLACIYNNILRPSSVQVSCQYFREKIKLPSIYIRIKMNLPTLDVHTITGILQVK